ncbi:acyl- binding protein [Lentinula edodes]|uniref:Acyl-binding protein n=1 Tax=Lentinula edodes TaxID=5353 RepID=A0A1Q3EFU8_LENED|nr:acyl- binding protein [Lentinula edodes]
MDASAPSDSFRDAASYLSNSTSLAKVSNTVKLELYALFKWLTVSPQPNVSRPSIFDMAGRAKWDAWNATGKQYTNGTDAENRYLEIAHSLGWKPGASISPQPSETTNDDLWDSDSDSSKNREGGGGMGISVSSMSAPETDSDNTLHGLAIAGDIQTSILTHWMNLNRALPAVQRCRHIYKGPRRHDTSRVSPDRWA